MGKLQTHLLWNKTAGSRSLFWCGCANKALIFLLFSQFSLINQIVVVFKVFPFTTVFIQISPSVPSFTYWCLSLHLITYIYLHPWGSIYLSIWAFLIWAFPLSWNTIMPMGLLTFKEIQLLEFFCISFLYTEDFFGQQCLIPVSSLYHHVHQCGLVHQVWN